MHGPEILVPIAFFMLVGVLSLGIPIVRTWQRRVERGNDMAPQLTGDIAGRLERIEHAVDAIAVEVERIAEGQRFTTKLLSERSGERDALRVTNRGVQGGI